MDPLSISASILALVGSAGKIIQIATDMYHFSTERQNFLDGLQGVRSIAKRLDHHLHKAHVDETWYDDLRDLVAGSGTLTDDGKYLPGPTTKSEGPLARMYKIMAQLLAALLEPAARWKRLAQKVIYHWDKSKYEGQLRDLLRCRDDVNFV